MLTIHHLGKSQSERIIWLCEELGLAYQLKFYERDAVTMLSPPELKALHPLGAAPVITDTEHDKPAAADGGAWLQPALVRTAGGGDPGPPAQLGRVVTDRPQPASVQPHCS